MKILYTVLWRHGIDISKSSHLGSPTFCLEIFWGSTCILIIDSPEQLEMDRVVILLAACDLDVFFDNYYSFYGRRTCILVFLLICLSTPMFCFITTH